MFKGLAPAINGPTELNTLEKFVRDHSFPRDFVHQVMVQHALAKFTDVLLNDAMHSISYSLVQLVDAELDGLRAKYSAEWTSRAEFNVLIAKLHLYATAIIRMHSDPISRDILLKRGFAAALRMVYLSDQGLSYRSEDYPELSAGAYARTLPKNYFRGLLLASIFLLRYFALNPRAEEQEQEQSRNHLATAHRYLKSCSTEPLDEQERGARLLENLSRQQPIDIESKPKVSDRLGASLIYEAITIGQSMRNVGTEAEDTCVRPVPDVVVESAEQQSGTATAMNRDFSLLDMGVNPMEGFGPLDYSLPEDLWGATGAWDPFFDIGIPHSQQPF
jgi:hypothetical protein